MKIVNKISKFVFCMVLVLISKNEDKRFETLYKWRAVFNLTLILM